VQAVNTQFGVYRKSDGVRVAPPFFASDLPTAAFVSGGKESTVKALSSCAQAGDVELQCVAVSRTADPLGAYDVYAFGDGRTFPDYPKFGVWIVGATSTWNCVRTKQFRTRSYCTTAPSSY
jgi:hypothetical protein